MGLRDLWEGSRLGGGKGYLGYGRGQWAPGANIKAVRKGVDAVNPTWYNRGDVESEDRYGLMARMADYRHKQRQGDITQRRQANESDNGDEYKKTNYMRSKEPDNLLEWAMGKMSGPNAVSGNEPFHVWDDEGQMIEDRGGPKFEDNTSYPPSHYGDIGQGMGTFEQQEEWDREENYGKTWGDVARGAMAPFRDLYDDIRTNDGRGW